MIILDSEKLKEYFKWISQGFQRNPLEVAMAITGILLILLIPPLIYIILKKYHRSKNLQRQKTEFENYLDSLLLTIDQREILTEMGERSWQLRNTYDHVLKSLAFFYKIGELIMTEKNWDYTELTLLAKKIPSLANQNPPRLYSTASLTTHQELQLPVKGRQKLLFIITGVTEQGIQLQMTRNLKLPTKLRFNLQFHQDYYSFETTVLSQVNNQLFIAHSHNLKKIQKRQFFRRATHSPVLLTWSNQKAQSEKATITDLSGGGARIKMTAHEPLLGDLLTLELPVTQNKLQVKAHVVRVMKSDYFSIAFDALPDAKRDKIIKHIIAKK